MIYLLFFLFCTVSILQLSKRIYGYYFTPLGVYGIVWGLALTGYYMNPFGYYPPSQGVNIILCISYFCFIIGCLTTRIVRESVRNNKKRLTYYKKTYFVKRRNRIIMVIAVTSIVASLLTGSIYLIFTIKQYGLKALFTIGTVIRSDYLYGYSTGLPRILSGLLRFLGETSLFLSTIMFSAIYVKRIAKSYLFYLPMVSAILWDFSTMSRSRTLGVMLIYIAGYFLKKQVKERPFEVKKREYKKYIAVVLLACIAVLSISYSRWTSGVLSYGRSSNKFIAFNKYEVPFSVGHFYSYFTGAIAAFNTVYSMDADHKLWLGRNSFYALEFPLKLMNMSPFNSDPVTITEYENFVLTGVEGGIIGRQNTYTYLRYAWDDFGMIGLFIIPFFLGYIATWHYQTFRISQSFKSLCISLLLFNVIIYSIIISQFRNYYILWPLLLFFSFPRRLK